MNEVKKPAASSQSRTVVLVVVALLIVVAIAGIVLAGRKGSDAPVATAPPAAVASSTSGAAAAPTDTLPNEVIFAPGSDKLPAGATETIARFVDTVRSEGKTMRISARYLTGEEKVKLLELAKARTSAVRHAVTANGLTSDKIQVEFVEMPAGSLQERGANRVELSSR